MYTVDRNFKILNPKDQGITTGPANLRPYAVNIRWLERICALNKNGISFPEVRVTELTSQGVFVWSVVFVFVFEIEAA